MADFSKPDYGMVKNSPVAPLGMQQAATAAEGFEAGDPAYAQSKLGSMTSKYGFDETTGNWYTGANQQGTNNGWDVTNGFVDKYQEGWNQALEDGTAANYFEQADATGIVNRDYTGEDGKDYHFGDVYEDGKFQGNIYDLTPDKNSANLLLLDFFQPSADVKAHIFSASDRYDRLQEEIDNIHQGNNENFEAALEARQFADDVDDRADDILDNPAAQVGIVGAGALGAGALGAGIGTAILPGAGTLVGGGIGTAIGGISAFLNRDTLSEQAARAYEIQKIAFEDHGFAAGVSAGFEQWGGFASRMISPLNNLVQGVDDLIVGDVGDGESSMFRVNEKTGEREANFFERAVDVASTVGDGFLQFASPVGASLYTAQMSSTILGEVGEIATTGGTFDYSKGRFDSIFTDDDGNFDPIAAAAGLGKVGIDVAQLGLARGLAASTNAARASVGDTAAYGIEAGLTGKIIDKVGAGPALAKVRDQIPLAFGGTRGLAAGETRVNTGAFSFTRNAQGGIVEGSKRRTLAGFLAPSEQLGAVEQRIVAMRLAAKRGPGATVSADDFYRAATEMATAPGQKIRKMLVNGMGEGYEEFAQGILEPISHGHKVDFAAAGEQALYGFAAGIGMQAAFNINSPNPERKLDALVQMAHISAGRGEIDGRTLRSMSLDEKKALLAQLSSSDQAVAKAAFQKLQDSQAAELTAGVIGTAKMEDSYQAALSSGLAKANDRTDGALVVSKLESFGELDENGELLPGQMPANAIASSARQLVINLIQRGRGLAQQVTSTQNDLERANEELAADPDNVDRQARVQELTETLQLLQLSHEMSIRLDEFLDARIPELYGMDLDPDEKIAETVALNQFFLDAFNMRETHLAKNEAEREALAHAVSMVFIRNPQDQSGSYQVLVPQISAPLTAANADNVVNISHAILPAIRGDFDGDKVVPQNLLIVNKEQWTAARSGQHFLGANLDINIGTPKWEKANIEALRRTLKDSHPDLQGLQALAADTILSIADSIRKRYGKLVDAQVLDEVLQPFIQRMRSGDAKAREALLKDLAQMAGTQIQEMARTNLSNEWLWIDQLVVSRLQQFQREYAKATIPAATATPGRPAEPNRRIPLQDAPQRAEAKAAVFIETMRNMLAGNSLFRMYQKLHYSVNTAKITDQPSQSDLLELAQALEVLGQGLSTTELENIRGKDRVTRRVYAQLERLSRQAQELNPNLPMVEMIPVIANMRVLDIDIDADTGEVSSNGNMISLAQLLLKRSVITERRQLGADVLAVSPELTTRLDRLERMTRSDSKANPARAFVEVVGSQQMYTLLGEDATLFGPQVTVEQFTRMYINMHEDDRRELARKLRDNAMAKGRKETRNPPYSLQEVTEGQVSGYLAMVDAITAVGNNSVSFSNGKLSGDYAQRNDAESKKFHEAMKAAKDALRNYEAIFPRGNKTELEAYVEMMNRFPETGRALMNLIPNASANAVIRGDSIANWVYEMLAMDPDEAEIHYLRHKLLAEWNALGLDMDEDSTDERESQRKYNSLKTRMQRIIFDLHPTRSGDQGALLQEFIVRLSNAKSVDEFYSWVNSTPGVRGNQAPLVPWFDDVAEFDIDKANGGWTTSLQGAEQREAVAVLQQQALNLSKSLIREKGSFEEDLILLEAIEKAPESRSLEEQKLYDKVQAAINVAADLGMTLGPMQMIESAIGAVSGKNPRSFTKGVSAANVVNIGTFDARRDAIGHLTNYERLMGHLTSHHAGDAANSAGELAKGDTRVMDPDGATVVMPKYTVELFAQHMRDPELRPLARAAIFPQVLERTQDGGLAAHLLVQPSLKALVDSQSYSDMFPDWGKYREDSDFQYVSMVSTLMRKHGGTGRELLEAVNDIVIAQTNAVDHVLSDSEIENMVIQAFRHVARNLRDIATMASPPVTTGAKDPLEDLSELVLKGLRDYQRQRVTPEEESIFTPEELIEDLQKNVEASLLDRRQAALDLQDSDPDAYLRAIEQIDAEEEYTRQRLEFLMEDDQVAAAQVMFSLPENPNDDPMKQGMVVQYVRMHADMISTVDPSLLVLMHKVFGQLRDPAYQNGLVLKDDEWHTLARAALSNYLEENLSFGVAGAAVPLFPDADHKDEWKYYDPTFFYLVKDWFDRRSPILRAAVDLHQMAGRHAVEPPDRADIVKTLTKTIFRDFSLGVWTSDLPTRSLEAKSRLLSASSADAVAMAGNTPKRQAVKAAATRRTFEVPGEELLSTVTLTARDFGRPLTDMIDVAFPGGQVEERPLAQLNNRFAQSVTLTYTDADGNQQQLDLMSQDLNLARIWYANEAAASSGYAEVNLTRIAQAADVASRRFNFDPATANIEVRFFHPDSQPATGDDGTNWMHNLFFEGTSFNLHADHFGSLISGLYHAPGGISPTGQANALDASKLGLAALQVLDFSGIPDPTVIEELALTDLAAVIRAKTEIIMATDLGFGKLDEHYYNAVHKDVKLHHFVRVGDELWTAERVIAMQRAGEALPEGASLFVPSERVLNTLLGELGTQGAQPAFKGSLDIDLAQVPTFRNVRAEALELLPGWNVADRPVKESTLTLQARQTTANLRGIRRGSDSAKSSDTRLKYFVSRQTEVDGQRAQFGDKSKEGFSPRANLRNVTNLVGDWLRSQDINIDWGSMGIDFVTPRGVINSLVGIQKMEELDQMLRAKGQRTGFIYAEGGQTNVPEGYLNQHSLTSLNGPMRVTYEDIVAIQMDSFGDDYELAIKRIQHFIEQGAYIVLIDEPGVNNLGPLLAGYLRSQDYDTVGGNPYAFGPVARTQRSQNLHARQSTEWAIEAVSPANRIGVFLGIGIPMEENTAGEPTQRASWAHPKDRRRGNIGAQVDLMPTNAFADYNVPATPEQTQKVINHLLGLDDADGIEFLANMANGHIEDETKRKKADEKFRKDFRRLINRLQDYPSSVLPPVGSFFGTGEMIPLINNSGQVLIYRHGYKAPKNRLAIERQQAQTVAGSSAAHNVAIYSSEEEPQATTHEGMVRSIDPRNHFGFSIELNTPLQSLGDKVVLEWNGMKYVTAPLPDGIEIPDSEFMNGWNISLVSDAPSAFGKEATLDLLNNHRNAFAMLGIDFTEDLTEFFFPGKGKDSEAQQLMRERLNILSRDLRKLSREEVSSILGNSLLTDGARSRLQEYADATMQDKGWVDRLNDRDVTSQIAFAVITYLMSPGAQLKHVLYSGGFDDMKSDLEAVSIKMPRAFTRFFDNAPIGSPLRQEINRRLDAHLPKNSDGSGYRLNEDFSFEVLNVDPTKNMTGWLQIPEAYSSGDNPVFNGQAYNEYDKQQYSMHTANIAYMATSSPTAITYDVSKARAFARGDGLTRFESGAKDTSALWSMLTDIRQEPRSAAHPYRNQLPLEAAARDMARVTMSYYRRPTQTPEDKGWTPEGKLKFEDGKSRIAAKAGLPAKQKDIVEFWLRQLYGAFDNGDENGHLTQSEALQGLEDIEWNIDHGYLPTAGAEVPAMHVYDLQMLWQAGFRPRITPDGKERAETWDEMVDVALGLFTTGMQPFDPFFRLAVDGFMHTYQNATKDLSDLPVSVSSLKTAELLDPNNQRLVTSIDPRQDRLLQLPNQNLAAERTLEDLVGAPRLAEGSSKRAPKSEISRRRAARRKARKESGVPLPIDVSARDFRKNGADFRDASTNANALARTLINIRVGTALINPALYISMGPEQWVRGTLDKMANLGTLQSTTGRVAKGLARATERSRDNHAERIAELERLAESASDAEERSKLEAKVERLRNRGSVSEALGLGYLLTPDQIDHASRTFKTLGSRNDFKSMLYGDIVFINPRDPRAKWFERQSQKYAKLGAGMQDPTYGMRGDTLARRYVEAIMQHLNALGSLNTVSTDELLDRLDTNPHWVRDTMPEAHKYAMNAIAQIRSLKQTPWSLALRGIYEPLSEHPNGAVSFFGNVLLKMPLIFSGYTMNVATTITGMQGASDFLGMWMEGRAKPGTLIRRLSDSMRGVEHDPSEDKFFDMSSVIEGVDLSRSFIRGGITHTGLFVVGMLMGGLNLGGESDEARKRRLMEEMQGVGHLSPMGLANDFRNADAIFLNNLPLGLSALFTGDDENGMFQPHWMLKQFLSPVMGIDRFFQTGDFRNIIWGYEDALGSFPLINKTMWSDTVETVHHLLAEAKQEEARGDDADMPTIMGLMVSAVGSLENMLFENSFVNGLYTSLDRYDRDPYKLPLPDSDGDLQKDIEGDTRPNNLAVDTFRDEDNNLQTAYQTRNNLSALMHSFTENRATLASIASVLSMKGPASDYIRYNMPKKTVEQELPPISKSDAYKIVLALQYKTQPIQSLEQNEAVNLIRDRSYAGTGPRFDYSTLEAQADQMAKSYGMAMGSELRAIKKDPDAFVNSLDTPQAKALVQMIMSGMADLDSPYMQQVSISGDVRQALADEWTEQIKQEGINMGLTESHALSRAKRIMGGTYGDSTSLGIADYLFSDKIPYTDKLVYNQLNTTYVTGPDGKPTSTGFHRDGLWGVLGVKPLIGQYTPEKPNMGVDERMNSTNLLNLTNTGRRALELADQSAYIPTDVEIGKAIEAAIEKASKAEQVQQSPFPQYTRGGYGGYGGRRRYGYSGGGGGGGYPQFTRMYALPFSTTPYVNDIPFINTSNPIIRRATIRRERVWSERGRLKQWQ